MQEEDWAAVWAGGRRAETRCTFLLRQFFMERIDLSNETLGVYIRDTTMHNSHLCLSVCVFF